MVKSMTGYGRAEAIFKGRKIAVEIKSLNHRYLEVSLRLPNSLTVLEMAIKKKISERFSRGRIETTIRIDSNGEIAEGSKYELNEPLLRNYHALLFKIKETYNLEDNVSLATIAGLRDIFVPMEAADDPEELLPGLQEVLEAAMQSLTAMREKEGDILSRDLMSRLDTVRSRLEDINLRVPAVVNDYRKRLMERVKELTEGIEIDEARLCQEVAIMAEKSDITEEIVRFKSHIDQMIELLAGSDPAGRKADFLIQEMNREANTTGSKSSDTTIARNVIEIKSELAKLREQVQNIE
ncbi:MAG: YicC family protein [Syntrophaceae bacterium]|nr:YicC family protein [Syntrophaceae bacterium]